MTANLDSSYLQKTSLAQLTNWSVRYLLETSFSYNEKFDLSPIGSFLKRRRDIIHVQDEVEYQQVTVKINGNGVEERDWKFGKDIGTKRQYRASAGQFIMSKIDARNGAFGIIPEELDGAMVTNDFPVFDIDTEKILPQFFVLLTSTKEFISFAQSCSSGTTNRQRIDLEMFLNQTVPLPEIQFQKNILDEYQSLIDSSRSKKISSSELNKNRKEDFLESLGIDEIEEREKIKGISTISFKNLETWGVGNPEFELMKIFDESKYELTTTEQIAKISSGGTPSRSIKKYYDGNILWVKSGEVRENIIKDTEEKITEEAVRNSSAKVFPKNSLIIAMYGATAGRTAILGTSATTNQACAVLYDINESKVNRFYLWYYFQTQINNFKSITAGSAQPNLNAYKIANYKIPVPPIEIQEKLTKDFESKYKMEKKLLEESENLEKEAKSKFREEIFQNLCIHPTNHMLDSHSQLAMAE